MSRTRRTRLQVSVAEILEHRAVPSAVSFSVPPALAPLSAAAQFVPPEPTSVSPVFALNFGTPSHETLLALHGLLNAATQLPGGPIVPPNPCSPVFFGLANDGAHD